MPPRLWHAHEILCGFRVVVIAGFLMAAGKPGPDLGRRATPGWGCWPCWGWQPARPLVGPCALYVGLELIVMIECVMAGRVIPAFTTSVTPGFLSQ